MNQLRIWSQECAHIVTALKCPWVKIFNHDKENENFSEAVVSVNINSYTHNHKPHINNFICSLLPSHCISQVYTEYYRQYKIRQKREDESHIEFFSFLILFSFAVFFKWNTRFSEQLLSANKANKLHSQSSL